MRCGSPLSDRSVQKNRAYALILATDGVFGFVSDSQELNVAAATRPSELRALAS
jgi:hypothetical protein